MSSYSARTALGAGASLEIRPTRPSDGEQDSDAGGGTSTADVSHGPRKGSGSEDNKVVWGKEDDGSGSVKRNRNAGPARRSSTGSSGVSGAAGEYQDSGSGAAGSSVLRSPVSGRGPASGSSLGSGSASASASAFTSASQQFQPDPLLSRLSATAVLPEDEEVVHKAGGGESTDLRDMRQDSYLGWGSGGAEMPPPAPGAGVPSRGRWGSGHYYKVCGACLGVEMTVEHSRSSIVVRWFWCFFFFLTCLRGFIHVRYQGSNEFWQEQDPNQQNKCGFFTGTCATANQMLCGPTTARKRQISKSLAKIATW